MGSFHLGQAMIRSTSNPTDLHTPPLSQDELEKRMRALTYSFLAWMTFTVVLVIGLATQPEGFLGDVVVVGVMPMMWVSWLAYLIILGLLANGLRRSWIVFCGLTIMLGALGPFVTYNWIKGTVKKVTASDKNSPPQNFL